VTYTTLPTDPDAPQITLWVVTETHPGDPDAATHVYIDRRIARAALIDAMRSWACELDDSVDRDDDDPGLLAHVEALVADEAHRMLTDEEFTCTLCDEATLQTGTFRLLVAQ